MKKWIKRFLVGLFALLFLLIVGDKLAARKQADFFSCNEQGINAFYAEQGRSGKTFEANEQAAMEVIFTDHCMDARGFQFTGGAECNTDRANECYTRKWWPF